jgi:hypothetical protein
MEIHALPGGVAARAPFMLEAWRKLAKSTDDFAEGT